MKKGSVKKIISFILSNTVLIMLTVLLVFSILDIYNPMMGFMTSKFTYVLFIILIAASGINSLLFVLDHCKKDK